MTYYNIYKQIIEVSNNVLDNIDLQELNKFNFISNFNVISCKSGQEHYRLLSYISRLYDNISIMDIGTEACRSSICLGINHKNKVFSWDIFKNTDRYPSAQNIFYKTGNVLEEEQLLKSPIIFLDTAHDGIFENEFIDFIIDNKYNGIIIFDDIHLNREMGDFWNKIPVIKQDITNIGHWSGTGIALFE